MNLKKSIPIVVFCSLLFFACDDARIFEENRNITDNIWNKDSIVRFEVDIKDNTIPTNFYINVRNSEGFPFRSLYLFIKTTFPAGQVSLDTLECVLADEKGNWLGDGMGDIYDNQIPFKGNVLFPSVGKYIFEIRQGNRMDNLQLIMDVGLRIERAE